jgi:hypothetical protein
VARLPVGAVLLGCHRCPAVRIVFRGCELRWQAIPAKAVVLVVRAWLSALVAIYPGGYYANAAVSSPDWKLLRLPRFLLQVMQFLYRYLTVLAQEAASDDPGGIIAGPERCAPCGFAKPPQSPEFCSPARMRGHRPFTGRWFHVALKDASPLSLRPVFN